MWNKIKTVGSIGEFTQKNAALVPLAAPEHHEGIITALMHLFQNPSQALADQVYKMIHPILEVFSIMAYPIAGIVITGAGLLYMIGFREKSVTWMFKTSIGYVTIQLLPLIVKAVLSTIGSY
ncbi:hypothetical protein CPT_Silence38 [Bacillus phage Silence]|nr:hypothetical protein CPT_Silence38 [Bacillus phage Silence]